MTSFAAAVRTQEARTANDMKALKSTANPCVDLFFKIGASRGKNIIPDFVAALAQNKDVALRIALWARDVRGGAGERKLFRDILGYLETNDRDTLAAMLHRVPDLGRWDDLFALKTPEMRERAFALISDALAGGHGLCAKWMPRKGRNAEELRHYLGLSPRGYRKVLVGLTRVVESQMCAKEWDAINFSHVPSVAAARYRKAFYRHTPKYAEYVEALKNQDKEVKTSASVKVNASAVYPYDVLKSKINHYMNPNALSQTENDFIQAQWDALPNYLGEANVLPLVDVSGSMTDLVAKNKTLRCLDVAVSLGLYCADKNKGSFKDMFLTFSNRPELLHLQGNIIQKIDQMVRSKWEMNTNFHAALEKILAVALNANVSQEEMPDMLLVLSDMQFDRCVRNDDSAIEMMRRKYAEAGYVMPQIVFWNLNSYDNVPVRYNETGTALVSGFSPTILKSILGGKKIEEMTPEQTMLNTVMVDRYAIG